MFRIRRLYAVETDADHRAMDGVAAVFARAFDYDPDGGARIAAQLAVPATGQVEPILLIAEDDRRRILGFAYILYFPDVRAGYLEWIASDPERPARGIGGALYEAAREAMAGRGARGLFLDVPPDDPAKTEAGDQAWLPVKRKRLAFYERYGARPIVGTLYDERTTEAKESYLLYLVYDGLGRNTALRRDTARRAVRAILTRKYGLAPDDPHVKAVVRSFRDDPVRLREPRYAKPEPPPARSGARSGAGWLRPLKLVVAERHEIHHLRTRGYVERPVRMRAIQAGLEGLPVEQRPVRHFGIDAIRAVHSRHLVSYLESVCRQLGPKDLIYPEIFPVRHPERRPRERAMRAGYYCMDTFTPLTASAWPAARAAVDCALTAAELVRDGERLAYALLRPPGHHAERAVYGGFCYFNNAAIAAHRLSAHGKVALLDIDHHHGNGSQDIFWERADVLTVSIHGHPRDCYPYFAGFADERGDGAGLGFNRNFPLKPGADDAVYLRTLDEALEAIRRFKPSWLVLSLGFDIMRGDPTGTFLVTTQGMRAIGERIAGQGLPTLVVQEGGYSVHNLRRGARAFFTGLTRGL